VPPTGVTNSENMSGRKVNITWHNRKAVMGETSMSSVAKKREKWRNGCGRQHVTISQYHLAQNL